MSPYLNLLRPNNGIYPNYYSFTRPEQQQQQFNQREKQLRRQQGKTLGKLQSDLQRGSSSISPTGTGSGFMISGSRSTFMNSSRYYPQ